MSNKNKIQGIEQIRNMIFTFRGQQVMIDRDLAELYGVPTKRLNEQVKRNINRFPITFRFQLSDNEKAELVANCDRFKTLKHSRVNPYAFTEQGIAMLSAVLRSQTAVEISIKIMEAFVEMRRFILNNAAIFQRLEKVEKSLKQPFNTFGRGKRKYLSVHFSLALGTLFIFVLLLGLGGCRKSFEAQASHGDFRVSADTVFLDSVFTGISSPTYHFKIYNEAGHSIYLDEIALDNGDASFYRLNVDGVAGKKFRNVLIPPGDSIYVFVELTADINALSDPVYEERLHIRDAAGQKDVLLTSFVKDAYFLYPRRFSAHRVDSIRIGEDASGNPVRVAGFLIGQDTTLTADKPVVIYGHIGVPQGKTLTVAAGAHLYFHFNSGIVVYEGGSLHIDGTLSEPVILEDDRMQPDFDNAPGMWNFIWLQGGSVDNRIRHAIIKNAVAGVIAHPVNDNGDKVLDITGTQIYNCSAYGLFAAASYVTGSNLVVNNCGSSALHIVLGGQYDFRHCTLVNYGNGIRNLRDAAVYVSNAYTTYDQNGNPVTYTYDLSRCDILNSIIYGNASVEFFAEADNSAQMHFRVRNSLIRFEDPQHRIDSPWMDFSDTTLYNNNVINGTTDFEAPDENNLHIGPSSAAVLLADPAVSATVPLDLDGNDRTGFPDSGAYQHRTPSN